MIGVGVLPAGHMKREEPDSSGVVDPMRDDRKEEIAPSNASASGIVSIDRSEGDFRPIMPCNGSHEECHPNHEGTVLKFDTRRNKAC